MAVRFVIGRAGSGKTRHALECARAHLRGSVLDGPRVILLVPEQAGLQMERALLDADSLPAAHRADVLSFRRLAFKVLETAGAAATPSLSEAARRMVLRKLVQAHAGSLRYYRRMDRVAGFVERLGATITELIQEAVEPADLSAAAGDVGSDGAWRHAKLHDIELIYAAYLDYLGRERLDPSQYLPLARAHLDRCPWLAGAQVFVDGFASFSRQELLLLIEVARRAEYMDITLLAAPRAFGGHQAPGGRDARLFRRTMESHAELCRVLADAGVVPTGPLMLEHEESPRFAGGSLLSRLERGLFELNVPPCGTGDEAGGVGIVELPSRRLEVEYAVSQVCDWVQSSPARRYRDCAVIVRDLELYHDLVGSALAARHIPFFIDRRRPVSHHPLVELLRAGLGVAVERFSLGAARLALKTGLLPLPAEEADALENYLLAHGISGVEAWRGADWRLGGRRSFLQGEGTEPGAAELWAVVNRARRTVFGLLAPLLTAVESAEKRAGSEWSDILRDWLRHVGADRAMAGWALDAERDGDVDSAVEHEQVWQDVQALLDDIALAFADVPLTPEELSGVLDQGLAGLELGLAPPMVDQVLVSAIERSRHPDIKMAVVLGFNDGVFPRIPAEDAILNDEDRSILRAGGVRVAAPARQRALEESLLVYIALTRASERLWISYARADNEGNELRPSPYLADIQRALPEIKVETPGDPAQTRRAWDIQTHADLARRLVMEFRERPARAADDPLIRRRWNSLYELARPGLAQTPAARRAFGALCFAPRARLAASSVEAALGEPLTTSVSQLETYAACPFQFHLKHILRLKERSEAVLAPVDIGQVHHAILEDFMRAITSRADGWQGLTDQELVRLLEASAARVRARLPEGGATSNPRDAHRLSKVSVQLARVLRAQMRLGQAGSARPRYAELRFGFGDPGGLPELELSTRSGRRVLLRGVMDRVDLVELPDDCLGVVIDYKDTRDKRLDLGRAYHGLNLQLLAYLLVLAEHGGTLVGRGIRPIAALYVSLAGHRARLRHPGDAERMRPGHAGGAFIPRGLISAQDAGQLDGGRPDAGWSECLHVFRLQNGNMGRLGNSDAANDESFNRMLRHVRDKLTELADGILDGQIEVRPYRYRGSSPCGWCPGAGVCRFEPATGDARYLETLSRTEVFVRLGEGGAAHG